LESRKRKGKGREGREGRKGKKGKKGKEEGRERLYLRKTKRLKENKNT